jgi:hypothetical protein
LCPEAGDSRNDIEERTLPYILQIRIFSLFLFFVFVFVFISVDPKKESKKKKVKVKNRKKVCH